MAIAYAEPVFPGDPLRVAIDLLLATEDLILGREGANLDAIGWLSGHHSGWEGLFVYLPASLRDRMLRAAGDLDVLGAEGVLGAAQALMAADAFVRALEGS